MAILDTVRAWSLPGAVRWLFPFLGGGGGVFGEASALRRRSPDALGLLGGYGTYAPPYTLGSTRVDYALARDLYYNRADAYKLGASFAKPIVNTTAAFCGLPSWTHPDEAVQQTLDDHGAAWASELARTIRNTLRDGDVFARVDPPDAAPPLGSDDAGLCRLRLIPPEWCTPLPDPVSEQPDAWSALVIRYPMHAVTTELRTLDYRLVETLTAETRTVRLEGDVPPEAADLAGEWPNPYGQIPVVHFRNEPEDDQLYGSSELEPAEPFLKAYHDVLLRGCQGHALFAKPKIKFTLTDKSAFLRNNFTAEQLAARRLRMEGKDLFFFTQGEDATFLTAESGVSATDALLNLLFFNIVDVSETPEFAFGTAVRSSRASVQEQMVPLTRKIDRKREQFDDPLRRLAGLLLVVRAVALGQALPAGAAAQIGITWPPITEQSANERATTVKTLVDALTAALDAGLISIEAAAETLRESVPAMQDWSDPQAPSDERRRVEETIVWQDRVRATLTPAPPPAGPSPLPAQPAQEPPAQPGAA